MPVRSQHLINTRLDDDPTVAAVAWDFGPAAPTRITLYVQIVKTLTPTNVVLTVELSGNDGQDLISYDKLITEAGLDAPVASVTYTATGDDVVSLSPEDVVKYINVTMTGTGTDATNFFDIDVWMVWAY